MNWSWNNGDPYMRGWGGVLWLAVMGAWFAPAAIQAWRSRGR